FGEVNPLRQRHAAGVNTQYLTPPAFVGNANDDFAIETARTAQRLVNRLGPICRGNDDEVGARLQPVHQRQQLRDETLFRLTRYLPPLGRDGIDLVDEQDRWGGLGRRLENLAQLLFGFAIGGAHDFRAVDEEEFRFRFIGDR